MVAWLCKYTKNHWVVQHKSVNYEVHELYLSETIFVNVNAVGNKTKQK